MKPHYTKQRGPEQAAMAGRRATELVMCRGAGRVVGEVQRRHHATEQTEVLIIFGLAAMRLWSLHPSQLDRMGLLALWREGLLAQKVLLGQTKGYRSHPQLERFRKTKNPVAAISAYLWAVVDEASARGYRFDRSKIAAQKRAVSIPVTRGQMEFERQHLARKLRIRDPGKLRALRAERVKPHPMMRVVPGAIEPWEVI